MPDHPVRAFVDRPVTDIEAAARSAQVAAEVWRLPDPVLRRAGMNVIFTCGDVVLRVSEPSTDAGASIELARFLQQRGLRVPTSARPDVVVDDGMSVTAWELIEASDVPIDWMAVGAMVRQVHDVPTGSLPDSVPLPRPEDFPWWNFAELLESTAGMIDREARQGLEAAVARHAGWHDFADRVVCHGDVHPGNVMMTDDGPVLIDWDLLCWAPPGWDHGPMMTWDRGGVGAAASTRRSRRVTGGRWPAIRPPRPTRCSAWLRRRSCASAPGMNDPAAMPEAQSRLRYWRGEPDAPAWRTQ